MIEVNSNFIDSHVADMNEQTEWNYTVILIIYITVFYIILIY